MEIDIINALCLSGATTAPDRWGGTVRGRLADNKRALVAELAYAPGLGPGGGNPLRVQISPKAVKLKSRGHDAELNFRQKNIIIPNTLFLIKF